MKPTYNDRRLETWTVAKLEGGGTVVSDKGWGIGGIHDELHSRLRIGDEIEIEFRGSMMSGQRFRGEWHQRKSDQDMAREHEELVADIDRRHREHMEENRADWERRTVALPEWIRSRLEYFIHQGGENFTINGWGYELIIAELAVMYAESAGEDTPEITAYADREGTSGNQHGVAASLARVHLENPEASMAGTIAALAPLTGDTDYSDRS